MAGKDNNIGIKISTDIADLKSGIKSIKDEISRADKDFQKATAGLDKWTASSEGLEAKLNQLNTKLTSQKKSVELYKDEIERVSKLEGDHSVQLQQLKDKLESAEIAVSKTEKEIKHYSNSLEDVTKKEKEAETELGKLTKTISEQESELKDLQTEYKNAVITYGENSEEAKTLAKQISKLSDELDENKNTVKKADDELEKLDKQFDETADSAEQFSKGIDGIKSLGSKVAGGIATIGASIGALAGGFLATAEGTREFRNNMAKLETGFTEAGLTAEDATNTFKELYSVLGDEGQATEATAFLAKFADDEKELASATHTLTGIYATFGAALPLEGLTEAINHTSSLGSVQGNLADALEWSGVNVDDFNAQLEKCSDEEERQALIMETLSGIYDGAADTYKEVNKDVIDSNKAQANLSETMAKLGEKAEPILTVVKEGFNQVLQEILKLTEGVDFNALAEKIKSGFAYFIDTIIPAIKDGFQWVLDNKDVLIAGIVAIGTAMLAWNVVSIVQGVVGAIKGWQAATTGMTTAQALLNAVMSANPIGLVIAAVAGLVAGFVLLWNKSDAFREFWIGLWEKLKSVVRTVVDWIKENWDTMLLFLMHPVAGVFKYLYENFDGFRNKVDEVVKKVVQFFKDCWSNIKEAWSGAKAYFDDLGEKIANAFKNIPSKIKEFFSNAWNNVKTAWSTVTTFFTEIKDNVIDAFKELPSKMLDVGKNLVEGLWNGIKDMSSWVTKKIKGFTDDVLGGIKKFFGIHSPSKEMAKIGKFLDEGLAQGIEKNKTVVTKATDNLGKELLGSLSGIEKQIENKKLAEKLVALGGKSENPFKGWTHAQLNEESVELESTLANINKQIIENGINQEQWGTSQDKMIERANLLEERYQAQLKLIDIYTQKLKYYETSGTDVPDWVKNNLEAVKQGVEITLNEYTELSEKIGEVAQDLNKPADTFVDKFEKAFGLTETQLNEWQNKAGKTLSKVVDYAEKVGGKIGEVGSAISDFINQQIENEMASLDEELNAFNQAKDEELEKQQEMLNQGLISEEEFALAKEKIEEEKRVQEEETLKKKNELAKKQFNAQKANDIAQALIQGALAIVKGFAELGPIGGAINAGIQAGITAFQVGTIASQKFVPMLAKGGIIDSPTFAMVGEAGKEAVIPLENNTGWIKELAEKISSIMQKDFSFGLNNLQLQPAIAQQPIVNNYYYQTINSPKQLSRREIYRDSKNLLALKG